VQAFGLPIQFGERLAEKGMQVTLSPFGDLPRSRGTGTLRKLVAQAQRAAAMERRLARIVVGWPKLKRLNVPGPKSIQKDISQRQPPGTVGMILS